jgi:Glycosyltransferase WbsX
MTIKLIRNLNPASLALNENLHPLWGVVESGPISEQYAPRRAQLSAVKPLFDTRQRRRIARHDCPAGANRIDWSRQGRTKRMKWRITLALWLLAGLVPVAAKAQVPDDIAIGAIRWDSWYEGAPDQKVLEQPEWKHRAPFFARYDENGKLRLDGDKEHVLHAEVAYARAIGIDYFIFGFYPDTGSWGRDMTRHFNINRALISYLRLADRMSVKFAISLNQLFPSNDVQDISSSLASFTSHPDYIKTKDGRLPVFILAHDGLDWSRFFGNDEKARLAIRDMRRAVREKTGKDIVFVIQYYDSVKANETAQRYGLDMVTTYSNFAPGKGAVQNTSAQCVAHGQAVWAKAALNAVPYAPNVTLGWDDRPRTASKAIGTASQGPWCASSTVDILRKHFSDAADFIRNQGSRAPFRTITIYAWNEFTEGGWMAPNLENGGIWMSMLRDAIGRNRKVGQVELTWPDAMGTTNCPIRTAQKDRNEISAKCRVQPAVTNGWPCPPGQQQTSESVRAASGFESLLWAGGWQTKKCN